MKHLKAIIVFGLLSLAFNVGANAQNDANAEEQPVKEVCEFLRQCGTYFIATVEGDQPRVRPFGTAAVFEGKL
ncbi:MAG: hypothetical protein LBH19_15375 [Dysgonamonadaceae bacterium]|jgi:hypothetical protein|nr:hypothetical protein [Dysgonamonadaceae bacterium]